MAHSIQCGGAGLDGSHTAKTAGQDDHFRVRKISLADLQVGFHADAVTALDDFSV
jgi:hypothetical protein